MSDKSKNLNPLFSNSVTGLTFDDFTNRAILLPAADIPKKETTSIKREDSLENFSEISLDSSSVHDQPQQVYHHPLESTDHLNNLPPQLDLNQRGAEATDVYGNKFASDLQASFSQLPSVASTVFSTFSSIIKGTASPSDVNQNSGHQTPLPSGPQNTLDELYGQQQYGGGGLVTEPTSFLSGDAILPPVPNQPAPTFFSPDDPLLTSGLGPQFPITETGGNAFRLGTNKKKLYAHVPGLSGNQPPVVQPIEPVNNFITPPVPQPIQTEAPVPTGYGFQDKHVPSAPPVVENSSQSRFSLTSFLPSQILEKIPKAASTFYQQTPNTTSQFVGQQEFSGFGTGIEVQSTPVAPQVTAPPPIQTFDPRNFNTKPISEPIRPATTSPLQPQIPQASTSVQKEDPLPPPPTFFSPSQVPVVPKSTGVPSGSLNPYSSSKLSRGIVSYKNNSLIPLANTGPILIPGGQPAAQSAIAGFFNPTEAQSTSAPFFAPEATVVQPPLPNQAPAFFQPPVQADVQPHAPLIYTPPQQQSAIVDPFSGQQNSPPTVYQPAAVFSPPVIPAARAPEQIVENKPPPPATFFSPIVPTVTTTSKDVTDVVSRSSSNLSSGPPQSSVLFNYFQRQSSNDCSAFGNLHNNSLTIDNSSCLADESLVVHASNTSLNTSFCSEIQSIFDKDQQQPQPPNVEFQPFENNYTNAATPSPPPFPVDITAASNMARQSPQGSIDITDTMAVKATTNIAYRPVYKHWFYKLVEDTKTQWLPFSMSDSLALEDASQLTDSPLIATDGGRFDVNIPDRLRTPIYWSRPPNEVRRCSWFYKSVDSRFVPYEEEVADRLEDEYKECSQTGQWHRKIAVNNGETVVFHGPSVMVHFLQSQNPDSWSSTPVASNRPRVVKRGCDEFNIDDGEPEKVDHLLFMVHGIGAACDLKFRTVEEVVDEFRSIAQQLVQSHYRTAFDQGDIGRVEVLPISWHNELHSEESGIDEKLKNITLESIPKLRAFTNDSILDVLFYTSPVFCQSIIETVGNAINRSYTIFRKRNPSFNGGVSLAGHSLGSLILFDLLCHQTGANHESEKENMENPDAALVSSEQEFSKRPLRRTMSQQINYTFGTAGTGAPSIVYPQLLFHVTKFFAMGSPIGMFVTIRGVDKLGLNFHLPTCDGFFNIFHPYDPVAYRCEPLINADLAELRPVLIKHHKGRKRMHLELKETIGRVSSDLKQKIYLTFRNALDVVYSITAPNKTDQQAIEKEVDKVLEDQLNLDNPNKMLDDQPKRRERTNSCSTQYSEMDGGETDLPLGLLNNYRRVDYVLQEAPLEFFNEYLFALTSHVCYWESEDTILFVIKEIYTHSMGVATDSQIPSQTMLIERPVSVDFVEDDEDESVMVAAAANQNVAKR